MNIKNIITAEEMQEGEFGIDWQEFVSKRQDKKEDVRVFESFKQVKTLLAQIDNEELRDNIEYAVIAHESMIMHISYNDAFLDGLKLILLLKRD